MDECKIHGEEGVANMRSHMKDGCDLDNSCPTPGPQAVSAA